MDKSVHRGQSAKQAKVKYCVNINEGLKISTWLQGDQPKCLTTVNKSIKIFQGHLDNNQCNCITKGSNLLILAASKYHQFFLSLERFSQQVEEAEKNSNGENNENDNDFVFNSDQPGDDDQTLSSSHVPNPEAFKPSRYSNLALPQLVNPTMLQALLVPLKQCILNLKEAVQSHRHTIPMKLLDGLRVNNLLYTCYNIFQCYKQPDYRYYCARIMLEVTSKIMTSEKETLLIAYHLLIRLYLDYNCMSKAMKYSKLAQLAMTAQRIKNFESYQAGLLYLDQCEIDLRNGESEQSGQRLKKFIESEYLKKLTLNRYHLKGCAYLLASKFPTSYQYSSNYSEFIEPLHIAVTILKRWYRSMLTSKEPEKSGETEEDHAWFKYEIYDFTIKTLNITKTFYLNVGYPYELSVIFNCLLTISRRNCFLLWTCELLKMGAAIDAHCDKKKPSIVKLENALSTLTFIPKTKISFTENTESEDADQVSSPLKLNTKLVNTFNDMDTELCNNDNYHEFPSSSSQESCIHDLNHIYVWEIERILRKNILSSNGDDDDEGLADTSFTKRLTSFGPNQLFPINLYLIEILVDLSFVQEKIGQDLLDKIKDVLFSFTSRERFMFQKLTKSLHITDDELDPESLEDVLLLKLKLANMICNYYFKNQDFTSIVNLCSYLLPFFDLPLINYTIRDYIGRLVMKLILAKIRFLNLKPSYLEYDAREIEEKMVRPAAVFRTPSPPRTKNLRKAVAPKREAYKMEELKNYAKSLHKSEPMKKSIPKRATRSTSKGNSVPSFNESDNNDIIIIEEIPPTQSQRKLRAPRGKTTLRHNIKNKNSSSDLYSSITENSGDPVDSLSKAIECITIVDDGVKSEQNIDVNIDDVDVEVFTSSYHSLLKDVQAIFTVHSAINMIKSLLTYFTNHPPIDVYSTLHHHLFHLYASTEHPNNSAVAYHLYESVNATMIRYRTLIAQENKKRIKVQMQLKTDNLVFNSNADINYKSLEKFTKHIPSDWRIVQIYFCQNEKHGIPDLIISRFQKNKKTLVIRIKSNPEKFTRNFMDEFYEIIQLSNASIRKQDSQTFWSARAALDQRLSMLLQSVGETWLGPFKSIFLGHTSDSKLNELCAKLKNSVASFFNLNCCRDKDLLGMVLQSFPILSKQQFESAMCLLFDQFSFQVLEECYHHCIEVYDTIYSDEEKKSLFNNITFGPVGLIVNKPLEGFPFESLPSSVLTNQEFFRIPSLRFLSTLLESHLGDDEKIYMRGVKPQNAYYLLNPTNNLLKTEKRFKDKFLSQKEWKGVIGKPPDWKELKTAFETKDLYIYFGHGAGSSYYKQMPEGIESITLKSASLVVGCCSGKLFNDGPLFDSFGVPYRFIINGGPTYLGVLWDVTDGDIDRFADRLLSFWIPDWSSKSDKGIETKYASLCQSLIQSRSACRFPCLTGAAPVIYGLPVSVFCKK